MLKAENAILNAHNICYIVILFLLIKLQTFFFKKKIEIKIKYLYLFKMMTGYFVNIFFLSNVYRVG